jgi:hypothetical protein
VVIALLNVNPILPWDPKLSQQPTKNSRLVDPPDWGLNRGDSEKGVIWGRFTKIPPVSSILRIAVDRRMFRTRSGAPLYPNLQGIATYTVPEPAHPRLQPGRAPADGTNTETRDLKA